MKTVIERLEQWLELNLPEVRADDEKFVVAPSVETFVEWLVCQLESGNALIRDEDDGGRSINIRGPENCNFLIHCLCCSLRRAIYRVILRRRCRRVLCGLKANYDLRGKSPHGLPDNFQKAVS